MAIERMSLIEVSGRMALLDDVLEQCLRSGVFQPEQASKLSEYSIGAPALQQNPYADLLRSVEQISREMDFSPIYQTALASQWSGGDFLARSEEYLSHLSEELPALLSRKQKAEEAEASAAAALSLLDKIKVEDVEFDRLFQSSQLKVRFGHMPTGALAGLEAAHDLFLVYRLGEEGSNTWLVYATARPLAEEADRLFSNAGFQRLHVPDLIQGTPAQAAGCLRQSVAAERQKAVEAGLSLQHFVEEERENLTALYSRAKLLHGAYDLRKYAVSVRGIFHLVGFVPAREEKSFLGRVGSIDGVTTQSVPACKQNRLSTPVRLRNNRFARPFEMFVQMYGSPSYRDIDPTAFVAWTYCLLFGAMFGDVGQGLCIALAGWALSKWKGMPLGGVMMRIGVSSALFGVLYGSVFGFEHLLDPLFHALGFAEKPVEPMHPATTNGILLAALALGAALILLVIAFNIYVGVRQRDWRRALLSQNGLAGFVFYGAALGAALAVVQGGGMPGPAYVICLLVLPLLVIFLQEPAGRLMRLRGNESLLHHHHTLLESLEFHKMEDEIPALFSSEFVTARFGRIPTDSFRRLHHFTDEPFLLYPIKADRDYIWCIYTMARTDKAEIDAVFHDLFFERIHIPRERLDSVHSAEAFVRSCIAGEAGVPAVVPSKASLKSRLFPEGVGGFVAESFFELFEVLLSFLSNTMSFLRVGGFVLSHAGMMSVVFTLSQMVSAGAGPFVIVFGNLFVMGLEGLIVGIQALRLEFYELFSRFFGGEGDVFTPVTIEDTGSG